ncbi:MAG TPA: DUF5317 domain-containing protein [Bacillota bacterium]|nr:DUF5317 domain-containing protein [Bacillota bacterium]
MLIYSVLISVAIGLLRGGRLGRLADAPLRLVPVIFLALLLRVSLHIPATARLPVVTAAAGAIFIASYLLLLGTILANRRLPGMPWMGGGAALNFAVIAANGMKMPVCAEALGRADLGHVQEPLAAGALLTHELLTEASPLPFLADIFVLPTPFPRPTVFSFGDGLLVLGSFILVQSLMLGKVKPTARSAAG